MPTETIRPIWLGALIAPLAAPLLFFLGMVLMSPAETDRLDFYAFVVVVALFAPFSYFATILVALPIALLLRAWNLLNVWLYCLAGALIGAVAFPFFSYLLGARVSLAPWALSYLAVGGVLGLGVAITFCIIIGITGRSSRPPPPAA